MPLRLAVSGATAAAVAAGVIVAIQPSGQPVLTVQLLADRAAAAALATPAVSAGQWVYERSEFNHGGPRNTTSSQDGWLTADGTLSYGAGSIGDTIFPYSKLDSLPRDPAALNRYFIGLDPVASDNKNIVAFSKIEEMLFGMILPPWLQAEMYHALALIPTVQVRDHVKDIAGRAGVAFLIPPTKQSEQLELILDATDYHLLAQASWDDPRKPASINEDAILKTVLVTELGSTQPATAPPSAAELAAERINWANTHFRRPPPRFTRDQWLYRDLRTGGTDRQIWATADDTAQARFVNGTLQVCKRTDPCAASEQWLMPAGPSYTLIYPRYPQYPQPRTLPALPYYPRPLLDKLNTYSTGCTNVADDCNVVNVAANVFTGYGNQPGTLAMWALALADVPGVTIQHITDAAGQRDIAFVFPFHDGVTSILLNAGTLHYVGYVRDGQQTLVMNQALVSGPGVLPAR